MTETATPTAAPAPAAAPSPEGLTDSQAQAQIEALLTKGRERGEDGRFKGKEGPKEAAQAEEAPKAEEATDEAKDEPSDESKDVAQEGDDAPEATAAEDADDDDIEIEEGGKKYKVPKVLAEGAMRQQQFTKEMTRISEQEKVVKAREQAIAVREAIVQELAPAIAQVQNTERHIAALRAQMPDPEANAVAYLKADKQVRDLEAGLDQLKDAVARRGTELAQQQNAARADLIAKGFQQVARDIPQWKDEAYRTNVFRFAQSRGYTAEELNSSVDPRLISLMHDAMQYRRVRDAKPEVHKKIADAAPVVRPTGTVNQASSEREKARAAVERVKKSHSTADAEAAVLALLRSAKKR